VADYPVDDFLRGVAAGGALVALAVGLASAAARRRASGRPRPAVGLPIAVATLMAIAPSRTPAAAVLIGLVGLTALGAMAVPARWGGPCLPPAVTLLLGLPFAWLLAADASSVGWVRAVVVGGATVAPVAAAHMDATWGPTGLTPALYAISAAGVFAAVPNTMDAAALLGASVPAGMAGWPLGRARLGGAGAAGAGALSVWIAAVGSRGREPAVVGAVACLGLLVWLPAGRWMADRAAPGRRELPRRLVAGPLPVLVTHAAVVAMASRVAGVSSQLRVAVPVVAGTALASLVAGAILPRAGSGSV